MPGADPEYQQQVAVFRYGVIADLLHAPPDAGSLAARIRAKTEQSYVIPHSSRTRIGVSTIYGWLQQYLQGGFTSNRTRCTATPPQNNPTALNYRQIVPLITKPCLKAGSD